MGRAGPEPSLKLPLCRRDLQFLLTSESKAKQGSARKWGQACPEDSSAGIGIPERGSYPTLLGHSVLETCLPAAPAPHHLHQGGDEPSGHFRRSWEGQLEQRHLNRFFSVVLLRIQPMGQATGSLGRSLIFASVGAISEQSIQRGATSPTPKESRSQRQGLAQAEENISSKIPKGGWEGIRTKYGFC